MNYIHPGDVACLTGQRQRLGNYHSNNTILYPGPLSSKLDPSSVFGWGAQQCHTAPHRGSFLLASADPEVASLIPALRTLSRSPHLTHPSLMEAAVSHAVQRWRPLMIGWSLIIARTACSQSGLPLWQNQESYFVDPFLRFPMAASSTEVTYHPSEYP